MHDTPTPDGYLCLPGLFSHGGTNRYGARVGATPNGRHAGAPVSHSADPDPGFLPNGALALTARPITGAGTSIGGTCTGMLRGVRTSPVAVSDSFDVAPRAQIDDGLLDLTETWLYSASGTASITIMASLRVRKLRYSRIKMINRVSGTM